MYRQTEETQSARSTAQIYCEKKYILHYATRLNSLSVFCPQVSLSQHLHMYLHSIHQQWNKYSRIPDGLILLWRRDMTGANLYTLMITQHCMCIFGFLWCSNTRTEDITGTKRQTEGCWIILWAEVHSLFRESLPWQTQPNVHWHTFLKTTNACDCFCIKIEVALSYG